MSHSTLVNVVAWCLVIFGCAAFLAAALGVVVILMSPSPHASEIQSALKDTYYIITRSKAIVWPLLLCMALSVAIAIMGYTLTGRYTTQSFQEYGTR